MLTFEWPWIFIATPLAWLAYRWLPEVKRGGAISLPFVLTSATSNTTQSARRVAFAILAWIALLVAASRPIWLGEPITLPASGRDIVLAVDLSGSMDEQDVRFRGRAVQRLAVVQAVAGEFIERREGDRIGLVLFGDNAYLQSPLSLDRTTTRQLLQEAEVGLAGQKTAIGDALGLSVKHMLDAGRNDDRVVILLTDGENNAGRISPEKAAELAKQSGVRIHTIGFSGEARGLFGQLQGPAIDARTLRNIADSTGGKFFSATNVGALEQIYHVLDEIEPVVVDSLSFRPRRELFFWPLSVALLLAFLQLALLRYSSPRT